jgi:hypothetical protein
MRKFLNFIIEITAKDSKYRFVSFLSNTFAFFITRKNPDHFLAKLHEHSILYSSINFNPVPQIT